MHSVTAEEALPKIPVHFVVLTDKKEIQERATELAFRNEIAIINRIFYGPEKAAIFKFEFKSVTYWKEIADSPCEMVKNAVKKVPTKDWALRDIWQCVDTRVIDFNALNYFLLDSYSHEQQYAETISYGFAGTGIREMQGVFIDAFAFGNESLQAHEFGHAFGLTHDWPKDNIMGGGSWLSGFNASQVHTMKRNAEKITQKLLKQPIPDTLVNGTFDTGLGGIGWQPEVLASPGHDSQHAGLAHKSTIKQKFFNRHAGKYALSLFVNEWGPGGFIELKIDGRSVQKILPQGGGGIEKPWKPIKFKPVLLKGLETIELTVHGGNKHLWFDDVLWQKLE